MIEGTLILTMEVRVRSKYDTADCMDQLRKAVRERLDDLDEDDVEWDVDGVCERCGLDAGTAIDPVSESHLCDDCYADQNCAFREAQIP